MRPKPPPKEKPKPVERVEPIDEIELDPIEIDGLERKPKPKPKNPFLLREFYQPKPTPTPTHDLNLEVEPLQLEPLDELKLDE